MVSILSMSYMLVFFIKDNCIFCEEQTFFFLVSGLRKERQRALLRMVIYEWSSYATVTCQNNWVYSRCCSNQWTLWLVTGEDNTVVTFMVVWIWQHNIQYPLHWVPIMPALLLLGASCYIAGIFRLLSSSSCLLLPSSVATPGSSCLL